MTLLKIGTASFVLVSGIAAAQDAPPKFQCDGKIQRENPKTKSQMEPFLVEIKNKVVNLSGLSDLEANFSLIQSDEKFYVFKNAKKTQGGNIDRTTGQIILYAVDKNTHKIVVSINGLCAKEN